MKAKTINLQIVKNLGNYESIRVGGEWELNGKSVEAGTREALTELQSALSAMFKPKEQDKPTEQEAVEEMTKKKSATGGKQLVTFSDDNELLQKIVRKIQTHAEVTEEQVRKAYDFDEQANKMVELAFKLR